MLSTSALTWAAAQDRVPVYELIRSLTPTDEARIEAAYGEWRRRAAAGERRHKVDWRNYSLSDDEVVEETAETGAAVKPSAKDVAAVPVPDDLVPAVETNETEEPIPAVETSVAEEAASALIPAVETNKAEETASDPVLAEDVPTVETSEAEEPVPTVETNETEEPVPAVETSEAGEPIPTVETIETEEPVHETSEADKEADQAAIEAVTEILEEELPTRTTSPSMISISNRAKPKCGRWRSY